MPDIVYCVTKIGKSDKHCYNSKVDHMQSVVLNERYSLIVNCSETAYNNATLTFEF